MSVPLPRKAAATGSTTEPQQRVWAVEEASPAPAADTDTAAPPSTPEPELGVCSKGPEATCCRELKGDDERALIDPAIVSDIIIGLSDGLTVPFALTAGLSGLGSSRIVVLGGLAELVAGALSMGTGGYLAAKAERDNFRYLRHQTHARVLRSCNGELEREVHDVLGPVGCDEATSRLVTENLLRVEAEEASAADWRSGSVIPRQRSSWFKRSEPADLETTSSLRWAKDVGVSAFLLRFGEGLEEVSTSRLYISAATIGSSYFMGGLLPLLPYFFVDNVGTGLIWSSALTIIILLLFGTVKQHFTGAEGGFKGYLWGAVSTAMVGGTAAACAFLLVRLLEVHE